MDKLEYGAAIGLAGLTIGQTIGLYTYAAPNLSELREDNVSRKAKQSLLDAEWYSGIIGVGLIGGTLSLLTHSVLPIFLAMAAFFTLSYCHHSILNSPPSE
jgi:hypothetical protein